MSNCSYIPADLSFVNISRLGFLEKQLVTLTITSSFASDYYPGFPCPKVCRQQLVTGKDDYSYCRMQMYVAMYSFHSPIVSCKPN